MINLGLFAIRLHHWTGSDDPRALHDHPWWFITIPLKGGYTDIHETGEACTQCTDDHLDWSRVNGKCSRCDDTKRARAYESMFPGKVRFRSAYHTHTVATHAGGCWTLLITGRETRRFGYWVKGKWMNAKRYFLKVGLHPCD